MNVGDLLYIGYIQIKKNTFYFYIGYYLKASEETNYKIIFSNLTMYLKYKLQKPEPMNVVIRRIGLLSNSVRMDVENDS